MKYTIELTDNQKKQMDLLIEMAHKHIGFNPKLEPMEEVTNAKDTREYKIGYNDGYTAGYLYDYSKSAEEGYNKGYNSAIDDYNTIFEFIFHNMKDFRQFLLDSGYYDTEMVIRSSTANILYDLIISFDMAEVIGDFKKWQEEKKQSEEIIKEGDIVRFNEKCHSYDSKKDREFLVLHVFEDRNLATILHDNGDTSCVELSLVDKTNRHIEEVSQLLDKLRGEEE